MLTEARSSPVRVTRLLTDKAACWVPAAVCSVTLAISRIACDRLSEPCACRCAVSEIDCMNSANSWTPSQPRPAPVQPGWLPAYPAPPRGYWLVSPSLPCASRPGLSAPIRQSAWLHLHSVFGQPLYFRCNHGKALPRFTYQGCLNGSVEGNHTNTVGNVTNALHKRTNLARGTPSVVMRVTVASTSARIWSNAAMVPCTALVPLRA